MSIPTLVAPLLLVACTASNPTPSGDVDCANGVLDPGEACDLVIADGQPGACPERCDDGVACTIDRLEGTACDTRCVYERIEECVLGDGCCAEGCTPDTDDDCSRTCGNGTVEEGERCDTAIASGEGACPTDCDDGEVCTEDESFGADCAVECKHTEIERCVGGDGCCPPTCDAVADSDCDPECGNGVVEDGESCDTGLDLGSGGCPTGCDDGDPCTDDVLVGSGCETRCSHMPIDGCGDPRFTEAVVDGDGPVYGLSIAADGGGRFRVALCSQDRLVVYTEQTEGWHPSTVTSDPSLYARCDLEVDGFGNAHVAFGGGGNSGPTRWLGYAKQGPSGWERNDPRPEPVGTWPTASWDPALELIGTSPRIAYVDIGTAGAIYALLDGDRWRHNPLIPDGERDVDHVEMAISDGGRPDVLWPGTMAQTYRHTFWNGSAWEHEDALTNALSATPATDGEELQVAFRRNSLPSPGVFVTTRQTSGAFTEEQVREEDRVQSLAFTIDDDGRRHIAYVNGGRLTYATAPRGGSWWVEAVPTSAPLAIAPHVDIAAVEGRVAIAVSLNLAGGVSSSLVVLVSEP